MAEGNFDVFASRVVNMPHIAANIIANLDITDVVSCLRTSKVLRSFLLNAIHNNKQLQEKLDKAVARKTCFGTTWKTGETVSLTAIEDVPNKREYDTFYGRLFALDGGLWLRSWYEGTFMSRDRFPHRLHIYSLEGRGTSTVLAEKEGKPKLQFLPAGKVLVDNGCQVKAVNYVNGHVISEVILKRKDVEQWLALRNKEAFKCGAEWVMSYLAGQSTPEDLIKVSEKEPIYSSYTFSWESVCDLAKVKYEDRDGQESLLLTTFSDHNGLPNTTGPIVLTPPHGSFENIPHKKVPLPNQTVPFYVTFALLHFYFLCYLLFSLRLPRT